MIYWICLTISLCTLAQNSYSQEPIDSLDTDKETLLYRVIHHDYNQYGYKALHWASTDTRRNPQVALIAGILPGGGQLYNRQFEKLLVYYAGVGGIIYLIDNNYTQYRTLQTALEQRVAGEPDIFIDRINTVERLQAIRDQYRKNLELSYFGAMAFYVVGIVDGFVSAHLSTFDISDDISLRPVILPTLSASPTLALSIQWKF